jgi:hypothetical protein
VGALAALAALALLVGCAPGTAIKSAQPRGEIKPPVFALVPDRTSIERFDPPGAGAGLTMTVATLASNPNAFPVVLEAVSYQVVLHGDRVATATVRPGVKLDAYGVAPLSFEVHADLSGKGGLVRAVARAFASTPLPFRIDGTVRFATSSYTFETRKALLVAGATLARQTVAPPRLRLDEAATRAFMLRPDMPVVQVVVEVVNPGDIGYFLYGKDLSLTLAGQAIAHQDLRPLPLAAGQKGRIDLAFYPSPETLSESGNSALQAALHGVPTLLKVEGSLYMDVLGVDSFRVPPDWEIAGFVGAQPGAP